MAGEIKSALEIALEKAEKIGRASKEELEWEKIKEEGLRLVGKYIQGKSQNFSEELQKFLDQGPEKFRKRLLKVILETLLKNLTLPKEKFHLQSSKELLKTLKELLSFIPQVDRLFQEIFKLLESYYFQKEAIYQELLKRLSASIASLEKAVSRELGAKIKIDPEAHPQFKEEWEKVKAQIDREYEIQLEYSKNLILKLLG